MHAIESWIFSFRLSSDFYGPGQLHVLPGLATTGPVRRRTKRADESRYAHGASDRGEASGAESLPRRRGYAAFVAAVAERVQDGSVFVSSDQAPERRPQRSIRFEDSRDGRRNPFRLEG
jgi:hypothetical protein